VVSEQRASRVTDIRSFVADVMRELAVRPLLDDPLDAVTWLGDITAVVGRRRRVGEATTRLPADLARATKGQRRGAR
jgi:hypothetical protein